MEGALQRAALLSLLNRYLFFSIVSCAFLSNIVQ